MINGVFISLRFQHPADNVVEFCKGLGFTPERGWLVGEPRQTPRGAALSGVYLNSYCTCSLPIDHATHLEDGLRVAAGLLRPWLEQLVKFSEDGGKVSFFISLEKDVFEGAALDSKLLADLGSLRISLDIDRNL
jgi:hypothetical protein